jgi:hypothetical protein
VSATHAHGRRPVVEIGMTGTEPASTNLINALSLIRTCRPTCTNSIRRSAIKRRTNRGPVFNSSPASSTVRRRSMCCQSLTVDTASGAPGVPLSIPTGRCRWAQPVCNFLIGTANIRRPGRVVVVGVRHRNRSRSSSVITAASLGSLLRNYVSTRCHRRHAARRQGRGRGGTGPSWP